MAALAATVTDRWGPAVSEREKERKKAVRRAGVEIASRGRARGVLATGVVRGEC